MRTWMLLSLVTVSLMLTAPALADDGLGLDFDDAGLGLEPQAAPAAEPPAQAELPAQAEATPQPPTATAPDAPAPSADVDPAVAAMEKELEAEAEAAVGPDPELQALEQSYGEHSDAPATTPEADSGMMAIDDTPPDTDMHSEPATEAAPARAITLGPMGVDDEGRVGRIHTVSTGDTLWDISNAYLGTPWVWPSVWNDNDGISNPHRISPGDHIWITAGEMRVVTDAQRDQLIDAVPEDVADEEIEWDEEIEDDVPAALGEDDELMAASEPTDMDELPVTVPADTPDASPTGAMVRVSEAESLGFVSPDTIDAAASIVDSSVLRTWLVDGDEIYIGLGEGEVQAGDEYTIYRDADAVRDLDGTLLGYHVEVLGWAVVREVEAESAKAEIRMSQSEIRRGDLVIPRDPININVPVKDSPDMVPGNVVYLPDSRTAMGDGEWVYVNRGDLHGVEPGTELEAYEPGRMLMDKGKRQKVLTPDNVVAKLIVVDTQPDSAVAYIVHSRRPIEIGDKVRPHTKKLAQR